MARMEGEVAVAVAVVPVAVAVMAGVVVVRQLGRLYLMTLCPMFSLRVRESSRPCLWSICTARPCQNKKARSTAFV